MKKSILTIALAFIVLAGSAQSKMQKSKTASPKSIVYGSNFQIRTLKPMGWVFTSLRMSIDVPIIDRNNAIDSLTIHVKKSQLVWLNDSTAIIHKP